MRQNAFGVRQACDQVQVPFVVPSRVGEAIARAPTTRLILDKNSPAGEVANIAKRGIGRALGQLRVFRCGEPALKAVEQTIEDDCLAFIERIALPDRPPDVGLPQDYRQEPIRIVAKSFTLCVVGKHRCINGPSRLCAGGGAIFERRDAGHLAEKRGQVFARAEAARLGHLRDRQIGRGEELLGPLDPHPANLHRR